MTWPRAAVSWLLQWHGPLVALALLPVIVLVGTGSGIDIWRSLVGWLFFSGTLLSTALVVRLRPPWRKNAARIGAAIMMAWCLSFIANCYVSARYGTRLHSHHLIEALANSTSQERSDYVLHAAIPLTMATLLVVGLMAATWWMVRKVTRHYVAVAAADAASVSPFRRRLVWFFLAVLGLLNVAILAHPTLRRENPAFFWSAAYDRYRAWERSLGLLDARREEARGMLPAWQPRLKAGLERNTVVLVIGESVNRWNLQLYGYPRQTTPRLSAMRDELLVFEDVVASAFSTVPNIERILSSATVEAPSIAWTAPTVPMLARAVGYKVFWLSNQADRYLARTYGRDADLRVSLNSGGSRGDSTLDGALVAPLADALADPAPLKFIIVHMLGAHPHYEMRADKAFKVFDGAEDGVQAAMRANRLFLVRWARNAYDNAMLYQDHVLAEFIKTMKASSAGPQRLLFVSDHGQEVGHFRNTFGHSQVFESGYVVPLVVWPSNLSGDARTRLERRPYQTDKLDWTLLALLGVATARDRPDLDLLGESFRPFPRSIDGRPYTPGPPQR